MADPRKECAECKMAEEFRSLCGQVERLRDEIDATAQEQRWDKYNRIIQLLMAATVHMPTEVAGVRSMVELFKETTTEVIGADKMLEALAPDALTILKRMEQGGVDAQELKARAMLHAIPDNAPRH